MVISSLCPLSWLYHPQNPSSIKMALLYRFCQPTPYSSLHYSRVPVHLACHSHLDTEKSCGVQGWDHQYGTVMNWKQLTASTRPFSVGFFSMRASNTSSVSLRTYSRTVCWKEKEEAGVKAKHASSWIGHKPKSRQKSLASKKCVFAAAGLVQLCRLYLTH